MCLILPGYLNHSTMKRYFLLLLTALGLSLSVHAQVQAYDGKIDYQKTLQPAAMVELPYSQDVVETALKDYMGKMGYKGSSSKGFTVFRSARLDSADNTPSDLYFKIERKRKERDVTILTLLPTRSGQDILQRLSDSSGTAMVSTQVQEAKAFLNRLTPVVDARNTDVEVSRQQDLVKKNQKKLSNLADDQTSLEKKIRRLQSDISDNKNEQVKQTALMQDNIHSDDETMKKAHKKMDKLLDDQGSLQKKLRKALDELEQNRKDQDAQQQEITKQQQILDALKAKQVRM